MYVEHVFYIIIEDLNIGEIKHGFSLACFRTVLAQNYAYTSYTRNYILKMSVSF